MLKQLAYVSHQAIDFDTEEIRGLIKHARRKNQQLEVTGLLLFDRPIFLQILEGPAPSVDQIIDDIKNDKRHYDMDIIYTNDKLYEREFSQWRMGCRILGDGQFQDYKALDARVKNVLNAAKPNGKLAHQLLLDFRKLRDSFVDI